MCEFTQLFFDLFPKFQLLLDLLGHFVEPFGEHSDLIFDIGFNNFGKVFLFGDTLHRLGQLQQRIDNHPAGESEHQPGKERSKDQCSDREHQNGSNMGVEILESIDHHDLSHLFMIEYDGVLVKYSLFFP